MDKPDNENEKQLPTTHGKRDYTSQQAVERQRKAVILGKLTLHYWRPDFTADQARLVMGDYLDDLEDYAPPQVQAACEQYRRAPGNEFFPKICQLLEILKPPKQAWENSGPRLAAYRSADYLLAAPRATRSVSQVLRQDGFGRAAEDWDSWKDARTTSSEPKVSGSP